MSGRYRCSAALNRVDIRPATHRAAEQQRLRHWSLDSWVRFFATGLTASAKDTERSLTDLLAVQADLKAKVRSAGLRAENAMTLVDYALAQPIFTVRQVQRHLGVTYVRANGLVRAARHRRCAPAVQRRRLRPRVHSTRRLGVLLR